MKMTLLFFCWSLVIVLINVANGFILKSPINTTTVVVNATTITVNTYAVCAVVTTASPSAVTNCRRRRRRHNYWIDPAFYISLNNHDDVQLSEKVQQFLNPTQIHPFKVEPTSSAFKTNPFEEEHHDNINHDDLFLLPGYYLSPSGVVQPSWSFNAQEKHVHPAALSLKWMAALAFFKNKLKLSNLIGAINNSPLNKNIIMTSSITTSTVLTVVATTSTKTYVISGCRPSSPAIPACY